jgi:hypothetical protein
MTPAWAQRQEALLSDCVVSPDVFASIIDRLSDFVVPYQHALETEAGKRHAPSMQSLSLPRGSMASRRTFPPVVPKRTLRQNSHAPQEHHDP